MIAAVLLVVAAPSWAQEDSETDDSTQPSTQDEPLPAPAPPVSGPEADAQQAKDDADDRLTYDPRGRRDPFRSLTGDVPGEGERSKLAGELRGLLWTEVKLTSIVKTPRGNIATFEGGPKKMGFFAREGDRFWNAVVHAIDFESATVVIREELADPRLLKPYRDHPISLRTLDTQARTSSLQR